MSDDDDNTRQINYLAWTRKLSLDFVVALLIMNIAQRDDLFKLSSWIATEKLFGAGVFTAIGVYSHWYFTRKWHP